MRFLVTGANGLVGSRVSAELSARGHALTALGRGRRRIGGAFEYASVDLDDAGALASSIRSARPDVIINAGGMTDVDGCETAASEAFRVNGVAPGTLALAAAEVSAHLVHVSTDYVFDGTAGPYDEDAIPNPRGVYALTKHIGEQAVRALAPSWAIARTAVVYGWPPAARPNFGSWLLSALRKGETVRLFEDQFVSPSLAESVAEQLVEIAERRLGGIWNVCGAEVVNRVQFGHALCAEFALDASRILPARLAEGTLKSPRPPRGGLRTDKATAKLTAQPVGLAASLVRFHQAVRAAEGVKA
ncbi:MAG: SDR family oxidoreductase [Myxococcaceae bacterium]